MAVANANPVNTRAVRDENYIVTVSAISAGNTSGINLVQATPYPTTETVIAQVLLTGGNGGNVMNTVLQHTNDNAAAPGTPDGANWANIPQLSAPFGGGNAFTDPTSNISALLPPNVKQWVRCQVVSAATTAGTVTFQLLF